MNITLRLLTAVFVLAISTRLAAQQPPMPPGMTHEEHLAQLARAAEMKARGAVAMGFDQNAAVHHFLLTREGGIIRVEAAAASDAAARDAVRGHLRTIAADFAAGDFQAPFATHAETPPGVPVMHARKSVITYTFEETGNGGQVRIATTDVEAQEAVHAFLRYQIVEHKTGDPVRIP
jgi:hypothetical protein